MLRQHDNSRQSYLLLDSVDLGIVTTHSGHVLHDLAPYKHCVIVMGVSNLLGGLGLARARFPRDDRNLITTTEFHVIEHVVSQGKASG